MHQRTEPGPGDPRADARELHEGLVEAADMLREFYTQLEGRPVGSPVPHEDLAETLAGTLGEEGIGLGAALGEVRETFLPGAMATPHPLYMGLINSSPLVGGIVAESVIGGLNNNGGSLEQSPSFSAAEQEVVRCFADLLGIEAQGLVLPGGSYATLHALQLAREHRLPRWRREGARSLVGDPRVYVSDSVHFSAVRSALALGVAERDVVAVPTVGRGAIDPAALRVLLREDRARGALPFVLVASLGTTGTGAVDDLPELVEICEEHDLWLHVDACYGGAAALLPEFAHRFEALGRADSVAVDPHKWFFVPMVAGLLFTRHPELELEVFDVNASYIPTGELVDGFRRGLPTSRRSSAFAIWLALRAHGLETIREAVGRNIALARRLEQGLRECGFQVMEGGELSVACARWEPEGRTPEETDQVQRDLAAAVVDSGYAWFATVQAQGKTWLRFNQVNRFTRETHVDGLVRRLQAAAALL